VAQTILETIKERDIDLLLMGWKGNTITPGRIFGSVVDTLIRQAPCDVVLVKLGAGAGDLGRGLVTTKNRLRLSPASSRRSILPPKLTTDNKQLRFNRWLVPMAGGPNSRAAIQLIPALVTLGDAPSIRLCQVFEPSDSEPDISVLKQALRDLTRHRNLSSTVTATPVKASPVAEGVINLVKTERFDVVVLGASREGLLQQAIKGNIPAAIASRVESTVILVRGAISSN
jgi:CIC family chloride channel protein